MPALSHPARASRRAASAPQAERPAPALLFHGWIIGAARTRGAALQLCSLCFLLFKNLRLPKDWCDGVRCGVFLQKTQFGWTLRPVRPFDVAQGETVRRTQ